MQYLCIHICYTLLFHHVYTHLTALPRGLSSSAPSLDQHHLDPWLAKLTCERALPGSTLPAEKSNLFSSVSGSSLTYLSSSPKAVFKYIRKSNKSLSISSIHGSTRPDIHTSIQHRKQKNHKVNSWSIAVPAACLLVPRHCDG